MGTNYYLDTQPSCGGACAEHCHGEEIHLGKSSAGWSFVFAARESVTDYNSWQKQLDLGPIRDEYGRPVSRLELLGLIEAKRGGRRAADDTVRLDSSGNAFMSGYFC